MKPISLVYINPQSYSNLSKYDEEYLTKLPVNEITYLCSTLTDRDLGKFATVKPIFRYNTIANPVAKAASYLWSLVRAAALIRRVAPDIVHVQWVKLPFCDYLFIRSLRLFSRTKVVYTAHNVVPHGRETRMHLWLAQIYRSVDLIFAHTSATKSEIAERFSIDPKIIAIIPHGLITLRNSGISAHRHEIEDFYRPDALKLCFFGRGRYNKGVDLLIDAWCKVDNELPGKSQLLAIGKMTDHWQPYSVSNIGYRRSLKVIDRYVNESDLYCAVTKADIAVFPYRVISQSGALLSVLGLRIPVLVSNLPGLTEPLSIAPIGWSFSLDSDDLYEKLRYLVSNPLLVAHARNDICAWDAVANHYDWTSIAIKGGSMYQSLLA